jgi:streptomycin 6-kinase
MGTEEPAALGWRVAERLDASRVTAERLQETETSIFVFGAQENRPVVIKVVRRPGDEWDSGPVLAAFEGRGVVRVLEHVEGALLLERLRPGASLTEVSAAGRDDDAIEVIAGVIGAMSPSAADVAVPTIEDWGRGFDRYAASGGRRLPRSLVGAAQRVYSELCRSQSRPRLLHGDLHHDNVLFDADRGWVAIDPKGVIGEVEYEVGAALRNPHGMPEWFANPAVIERRVERFASELGLDAARMLAWGFAQAVLSVIWEVEDGSGIERNHPCLRLADAIHGMSKRIS